MVDGKRSDPGSSCSHYSWFEAIPREAACPSLCWVPTTASGTVLLWHRKGPTAPSRGHTQLHRTAHPPQFSVTPLVWDAPRAMPSRAVMVPRRQEHPCAAGTKPPAALPPAGRRPPRASASAGALGQVAHPSGAGPFPARASGAQELCPLSHEQDTWLCFAAPSPWLQGHMGARGGLANAWGHAAEIKPRWHQSEAAPCIDGKDMPGHSRKAAQTQETQHNSRLLHPGIATPASNGAPSPEKACVFQPFQ